MIPRTRSDANVSIKIADRRMDAAACTGGTPE
jgi:hypothetical protein